MKLAALAVLAALAAPSSGWAQQLPLTTSDDASRGTPEERRACAPDVRKYCYSLKADAASSEFADCLKAHRAVLSKACDGVFKAHNL